MLDMRRRHVQCLDRHAHRVVRVRRPVRVLTAAPCAPVRASISPGARLRSVMHSGTGQTATHRLQPTHSSSFTSKWRWPSFMAVIAWCEVSSQAMWQRPHWMQLSWSITALPTWLRFRYCQSVTVGSARPRKSSTVAIAHLVHVVRQAVDHLLHDLEAVDHRRGADLHVARAQRDVVRPRRASCRCRRCPRSAGPAVCGSRAISATMFSAIGLTAGPQ